MKVKEIPVVCVIMKSHQNKAEKPTTKQSMKVLDFNVMAAISNRMERAIEMYFNAYLSYIKYDLDVVRGGLFSDKACPLQTYPGGAHGHKGQSCHQSQG